MWLTAVSVLPWIWLAAPVGWLSVLEMPHEIGSEPSLEARWSRQLMSRWSWLSASIPLCSPP